MKGINTYWKELTAEDIEQGRHRTMVGGLWNEIGTLQFEFLCSRGIRPSHKLLDIGCGCLRGGIHFIRHLDTGNYHGLDVNTSLIDAARAELRLANLEHKSPNLLVDDQFRVGRFGVLFDFMLSISVFTHLPMNMIVRCLSQARTCLKPGGTYFSTFFEAPRSAHLDAIEHPPAGIRSQYDADPFHYSFEEIRWMARSAGLDATLIGDWNHPRGQKMAAFSLPP